VRDDDPAAVRKAWRAYLRATRGLPPHEYEAVEPQAWAALCSALDQAGAPLRSRQKMAVT